ncbi:MAG TPA: 4Fe-4S dicluster domain-containing protein [Ktedonobacterales bacterium]|nr:4Fe-4S dicluster domain-containing protein [Ktedonobacterales bacterium]
MPRSASQVAEELTACIRCNECLAACPALGAPITIETLNHQTLEGQISPQVMRFAQSCYQCGACVPVCPVGLHRDSMMMWLKIRLLSGASAGRAEDASDDYEDDYDDSYEEDAYAEDLYTYIPASKASRGSSRRSWAARGWDDDEEY